MTIRDHLSQIQRPYTRWTWGFGMLFVFGGAGLVISSNRKSSDGYDALWYFCVVGLPYFIGAVGAVASSLVPFLRIRCPQCNTAMRGQWKRWKYCPFCAVELDGDFGLDVGQGKCQPDGPANGSQPIRLETNSTSSTAGSRR